MRGLCREETRMSLRSIRATSYSLLESEPHAHRGQHVAAGLLLLLAELVDQRRGESAQALHRHRGHGVAGDARFRLSNEARVIGGDTILLLLMAEPAQRRRDRVPVTLLCGGQMQRRVQPRDLS